MAVYTSHDMPRSNGAKRPDDALRHGEYVHALLRAHEALMVEGFDADMPDEHLVEIAARHTHQLVLAFGRDPAIRDLAVEALSDAAVRRGVKPAAIAAVVRRCFATRRDSA